MPESTVYDTALYTVSQDIQFHKNEGKNAWDEHTKIKSDNTLTINIKKGTYHKKRIIQFHILIYKQGFTIIPMKEENS